MPSMVRMQASNLERLGQIAVRQHSSKCADAECDFKCPVNLMNGQGDKARPC